MEEITFGSVCSGIEAASVAFGPLGWKAAWLSEIEPFPSAVLAHHYPNVPNLGDMTTLPDRVRSGEVEAPDVLCGGTPCQAFSVAGLRKSLDDDRGNLSLIFCELADEIDDAREYEGKEQSVIFWENVPGVLSTADNAFGCFLGALSGDDQPVEPGPRPESGRNSLHWTWKKSSGEHSAKWPDAGVVIGPRRAAAWRVLDAQYFGLAQRRRRVFVVASARNGFDPAAVLFECEGVRRDSPPRREAGEGTAAGIGERAGISCPPVSPALKARDYKGPSSDGDGDGAPLIAHPLRGDGFDASEDGTGRGTPLVPVTVATLDARTKGGGFPGTDGAAGRHVIPVAIRTANTGTNGHGIAEDVTHTLDGANGQAVAFQVGNLVRGAGSPPNTDVFPTLKADHGRGLSDQHPCIAFAENSRAEVRLEGGDSHANAGGKVAVAFAIQERAVCENPNAGPDGAGFRGDGSAYTLEARQTPQAASTGMQVRRLTPVECERLQGFPDGYTATPWRNKPASECPDGPRYKALGNSWAVPCVRWIGERINRELLK